MKKVHQLILGIFLFLMLVICTDVALRGMKQARDYELGAKVLALTCSDLKIYIPARNIKGNQRFYDTRLDIGFDKCLTRIKVHSSTVKENGYGDKDGYVHGSLSVLNPQTQKKIKLLEDLAAKFYEESPELLVNYGKSKLYHMPIGASTDAADLFRMSEKGELVWVGRCLHHLHPDSACRIVLRYSPLAFIIYIEKNKQSAERFLQIQSAIEDFITNNVRFEGLYAWNTQQ